MLTLPSAVRIVLATEPMDMRKSIDGLMAVVRSSFGEDVYSGHLFVFVSRRGDRVKILTFSRGGFILYYKRLGLICEYFSCKKPHQDDARSRGSHGRGMVR